MLIIRLSRTGKKHLPSYRLVVADKKRAVKGKYLDIVGTYNPVSVPKQFTADKEKILAYLKNGAQVSTTVLNLLCDNGVLPKNRKIKIVHAKKPTKEPATEKPETKKESTGKEAIEIAKVEATENENSEAKSVKVEDPAPEPENIEPIEASDEPVAEEKSADPKSSTKTEQPTKSPVS